MKKRLIQLALLLGLMALTCVAAQATESEPAIGFRVVSVEANYQSDITLTPVNASGATVELDADGVRYPGAVKMKVAYNKAAQGSEYLLCVLMDGGSETVTPSVDNMAYIDQKQADSAAVEFTAYPKKPDGSETTVAYSVYLSSNADAASSGIASFTKVASFELYDASASNVKLGDVNDDGNINAQDARIVLQSAARLVTLTDQQKLAANVNKDASVNAQDARMILQYAARLITSFD